MKTKPPTAEALADRYTYRCNLCGMVEIRPTYKQWIPIWCQQKEKMARLYRISGVVPK